MKNNKRKQIIVKIKWKKGMNIFNNQKKRKVHIKNKLYNSNNKLHKMLGIKKLLFDSLKIKFYKNQMSFKKN